MKTDIDVALNLQRISDKQSEMQKDFYEHQKDDEKSFDKIDEKFDKLDKKLDSMREDFGYIFVALKIIGFCAVTAWAAFEIWIKRRLQ